MSSEDALDDSARYVSPKAPGERDAWAQALADTGRRGAQKLREVTEVAAPAAVAEALGLPPGTRVVVRRRVMYVDDRPVELTDSYYPVEIAGETRLADVRKIPGGAPTLLAELGYEARHVMEEVSARMSADDEMVSLGLVSPEPVIVLFRITRNASAVPFEVSVMTMLAAGRHLRYQFEIGGKDA